MADKKCSPWKNGYYQFEGFSMHVFLVEGEQVKMESLSSGTEEDLSLASWKFGEFEEAREEIKEYTGKENYNVDIEMWNGMWKTKGVVNDEGTRITVWTHMKSLGHFQHISDEELAALKEFGEPASAPTSHYEIRPDVKGRLLWLSGAPGLGKSTTGLLLSKTAGYVYYEADTFGSHLNPYLPPDVEEPSLAWPKQKPLKELPQDRIDAVNKGKKEFMKMIKGEDYDEENMKDYYAAMCKNIKSEKQRMGGDWVVATIVPTRLLRDFITDQLGPDVVFIIFDMTKEEQMQRIKSRHGDSLNGIEWLTKMYDMFERAHLDERNAINVTVTGDMSREDVVEKVLSVLP